MAISILNNEEVSNDISYKIAYNSYVLRPLTPESVNLSSNLVNYGNVYQDKYTLFKLGKLSEQAREGGKSSKFKEIDEILEDSSSGRIHIENIKDLDKFENYLEHLSDGGAVQRILGFFTLVNVIWFFSIIAIVALFFPVIYKIAKPFAEVFISFCKYIVPILHEYYIFEFILYLFCLELVACGVNLGKDKGFMVCFSGLLFASVSNIYSIQLHKNRLKKLLFPEDGEEEDGLTEQDDDQVEIVINKNEDEVKMKLLERNVDYNTFTDHEKKGFQYMSDAEVERFCKLTEQQQKQMLKKKSDSTYLKMKAYSRKEGQRRRILQRQRDRYRRFEELEMMYTKMYLLLFVTACFGPYAIYFQSSLFGFVCVASFYAFLGFYVFCFGMCWIIGFDSQESVNRALIASLILVLLFSFAKISLQYGDENKVLVEHYLGPFSTSVLVMGSIMYFLSSLIACARRYSYYERIPTTFVERIFGSMYTFRNVVFIGSLLVWLVLGTIYQVSYLRNIAIVFTVLYAMEKNADFVDRADLRIYCLFVWAIVWYNISLYLTKHPEFVAALFDGNQYLTQ